MNRSCFVFPIIIIVLVALAVSASAQRYMEKLDRGLIAVPERGGKIYVGWRMLGTEPEEIAYNLYRSTEDGEPEKLNEEPITDSTNFVEEKA